MTILAISGSLRRSSVNSAVLRAAASARDGTLVAGDDFVRRLPHFDPDLEAEPPEAVLRFRAACEGATVCCSRFRNTHSGSPALSRTRSIGPWGAARSIASRYELRVVVTELAKRANAVPAG
jgi:hypothetical protein